jgi:hypothetical protein
MSPFTDTVTVEFEVVAGIAGILLLVTILLFAVRSRNLPVCWNCGYHSVRRAHSRRGLDALANGFFLFPHRCEKCLQRFYCFAQRRVRHSTGRSMAPADGRS